MIVQLSRRTFVHILFKRRWLFLGGLGSVVAFTLAYVLLAPRIYESTASILTKVVNQDMAAPDSVSKQEAQGSMSSANMATEIVNSERLLIESQDVLKAALDKLGPDYIYPNITDKSKTAGIPVADLAVLKLGKDIDVKVNANTTVIDVTVSNRDPIVAQKTLSTVITSLFDKQAVLMRDPRLSFVEQRQESFSKNVKEAQQALLDFKKRTNISSLTEERDLLLKQRDAVQISLNTALADLTSAQKRAIGIRGMLAKTPSAVPLTDENDSMKSQIDQAQGRLSAAESRYETARLDFAEGNPELVDAKAQLEIARRSFNQLTSQPTSRVRTGVNPLYQSAATSLASAGSDIDGLSAAVEERKRQLSEIDARVSYLDTNEPELADLQHREDVAEHGFQDYLERAESARIVDDLNRAGITSLSILQSPTLPFKPAKPKKSLLMMLSIFVGVFLGSGLCLFAEMLDETISRPEQIEPLLGLPVLLTLEIEPTFPMLGRHG